MVETGYRVFCSSGWLAVAMSCGGGLLASLGFARRSLSRSHLAELNALGGIKGFEFILQDELAIAAGSSALDMHDATDHAPIIDTPGAGLVLR